MPAQIKSRPTKNEGPRKKSLLQRIFKRTEPSNAPQSIGGVFFTAHTSCAVMDNKKQESSRSLNTVHTHSSEQHSSWKESGSKDHHKGAPLLARTYSRRSLNPDNKKMSEQQLLGRAVTRSRLGPKPHTAYASNHVVVNHERMERTTAPLKRIPAMDELARKQARRMADEHELQHSDPDELQELLATDDDSDVRIGENVCSGKGLKKIHAMMMRSRADRNNILDRRFTCMGMGTAKSSDGTLYLCQLFRE